MTGDETRLDINEIETLMGYALEHYIKHYDAVLRKLEHAKSATQKSMDDVQKEKNPGAAQGGYAELDEIKAYGDMWGKVISLFRDAGVSEDELVRIESILGGMPKLIKKYYDILLLQDAVLQSLLRELESEKYRQALEVVSRIQSKPDAMSGLDAREFDFALEEKQKRAFIFRTHSGKDTKN